MAQEVGRFDRVGLARKLIEDVTRRFAQAGYVAIAPDMFVQDGKRPAPLTKERLAEVLTFVNAMPMGTAFDPIKRKEALAQRDHEFAYRVRAAGKKLESHVYEGAEHAFFNDARPSFDLKATRDSYARTLSFFATVLA